jgi:HK97 family phage portal protein
VSLLMRLREQITGPPPDLHGAKAASLLVPSGRRRGHWVGDPVTNGVYVDDRTWGAWRHTGSFNYAGAVGDGLGSSLVVACLNAIARQFPEPPLRVFKPDAKGEEKAVRAHPVEVLWRRPNPFMTPELLETYIAIVQHVGGDAYLWKNRSTGRRPVELWPIAPHLIEPAWPEAGATTTTWITHYDYRPDSRAEPIQIPTEDVVHLRMGLNPDNLRKGWSPLRAGLAEIFTDQESTAFLAALLRNFGVPPVMLAPDVRAGSSPSKEQLAQTKREMEQKFSGERRGGFMLLPAPWVSTKVGYSPADLNLDKLHALPETRIPALLGIPAVCVGLLAGLDRATYSNADQLVEYFIESKMVPYWRLVAADLTRQLLPDFESEEDAVLRFDLQDVRALQEDMDNKYTRVLNAYGKGLITMNTGLRELGFPELGEDGDVLLLPNTVTPTKPEDLLAPPEPEPLPMAPPQLPPPGRATVQEAPPATPVTSAAPSAAAPAKAIKAAEVGTRVGRLRDRLTTAAERDLAQFFRSQGDRIAGRLTNSAKALTRVPPGAEELVPTDLERKRLSDMLEAYYLRALQGTHALTEDLLGLVFELDDPVTRRYLTEAGTNIRGITETTREAVRQALIDGQAAGESVPQLAKRLRDLPAFDKSRAALVARTELAASTNMAAQSSYEASGVVVGIEILDQESDEACQGWNGRRFSLAEARDVPWLLHPNCTQARAPLLAGEL